MGNCLARCKLSRALRDDTVVRNHHKVVQVVKMDGEILKFMDSISVNDLLVKFPGFAVWLASSTTSSICLPQNYELRLGNTYYLRPLASSLQVKNSSREVFQAIDTEENRGIQRIKLVISKQLLHLLLSKKISFDDVIYSMDNRLFSVDSPRRWKPKLEAIPEANEFCYVS